MRYSFLIFCISLLTGCASSYHPFPQIEALKFDYSITEPHPCIDPVVPGLAFSSSIYYD